MNVPPAEKPEFADDQAENPPGIREILVGLLAIAPSPDGKISLDEMVDALGKRAFGILFLLFGLPNCFPLPPGVPVLCGVVVGAVAIQLALGRETLALPGWLGRRRIARSILANAVTKSSGLLARLERFARPRYLALSNRAMRRTIGLAGFALAVALMAPIPVFGGIPPGIAVTLLGLAFTQRDGLLIAFGLVVATPVALAVTSAMVFALVQGASAFF